jgi:hypothetical protein
MKGMSLTVVAMSVCLTVSARPMLAHHSFAAEYDVSKTINLVGTVTEIEWTNPHARFHIDVKAADGTMASWELELGSPNTLIRYGWSRDIMKIGDQITVDGYLAKDGSKMANAKTVKFSDGRSFNAGSSLNLAPTK